MIYANQKELKKGERIDFHVNFISQPYFVSTEFIKGVKSRRYRKFPARIEHDIVSGYDSSHEPLQGDVMELREEIYNPNSGKMEFHRVRVDKTFYRNHAKKFSVEITFAKPLTVNTYDKEAKCNVDKTDTVIRFSDVSPSKIKDMLNILDLDLDARRKADGNLDYDYEDELFKRLTGKFLNFKTNMVTKDIGKGPITFAEFTFKEGKEFDVSSDVNIVSSIPEISKEDFKQITPKRKIEEEIRIEDIPF